MQLQKKLSGPTSVGAEDQQQRYNHTHDGNQGLIDIKKGHVNELESRPLSVAIATTQISVGSLSVFLFVSWYSIEI